MLGIGFWEMALIAGVALIVMGPDRFPEFAKIVMRTIRDLRSYVDDVKGDIEKELRPVKRELRDLSRYRPEDYIEGVARAVEETVTDTVDAVKDEPPAPLPYPDDDEPDDAPKA